MTNPTPPASPTSAEDDDCEERGGDPSHNEEWLFPQQYHDALLGLIFKRGYGLEMRFHQVDRSDAAAILYTLHQAGLRASPSPPAVVGKPTKEALAVVIYDAHPYSDPDIDYRGRMGIPAKWPDEVPKLVREVTYKRADAILAIWPTSEPPATVDDEVEAIDVEAVGRKIFSSPYYKGSVENARRDAREVMLLITGKKG